jgi:hypothetical protein
VGVIRLRRTLGGLVCFTLCRPALAGLGDWHSPFWGISFERPSSHGGVVHLDLLG